MSSTWPRRSTKSEQNHTKGVSTPNHRVTWAFFFNTALKKRTRKKQCTENHSKVQLMLLESTLLNYQRTYKYFKGIKEQVCNQVRGDVQWHHASVQEVKSHTSYKLKNKTYSHIFPCISILWYLDFLKVINNFLFSN